MLQRNDCGPERKDLKAPSGVAASWVRTTTVDSFLASIVKLVQWAASSLISKTIHLVNLQNQQRIAEIQKIHDLGSVSFPACLLATKVNCSKVWQLHRQSMTPFLIPWEGLDHRWFAALGTSKAVLWVL